MNTSFHSDHLDIPQIYQAKEIGVLVPKDMSKRFVAKTKWDSWQVC